MELSRRAFLSTLGSLAAGVTLPPAMAGRISPDTLEQLHEHARSLAQRTRATPPLVILRETRVHLLHLETLLLGAAGWQSTRLHRTAALTALVGARAARLAASRHTASLLDRAEEHAGSAKDGPLRAQVLLYRARHRGESGYALDAGSTEGERLLASALRAAGSSRAQAILRAIIRYELAWELAALGDTRMAMVEVTAADVDHSLATDAPDVVEVADRGWRSPGFASAYRGAVLRRAGLHHQALETFSDVPAWPTLLRTPSMVEAARAHAAVGEVDAAAATLRDAYLLNAGAGLVQRQARVRAARALLPDTAAVRELDAVVDG
jgi:hypothetical protein